jgi:archaemetzincin
VILIKIDIVPLHEVPEKILKKVREELKVTFRMIGDIKDTETLPKSTLNPLRNQYVGEEVLKFLEKNYKGRVLGITQEDLYTKGLNFIFGLAKMKGRVALVSIARLNPTFYQQKKDDKLFERRVVKEVIHEVGHMLGLTHCNKRTCVMAFSNTVGQVDRKTNYLCNMCKLQLGL